MPAPLVVPKLLRLICCETAPDGERLAAVNRLSAVVTAHDVDWDRVLANGNTSGLNEEAASKIYWEGHARGCTETEQRLRPAHDWTPTNGSTKAGDDAVRVKTILDATKQAIEMNILSEWETTFLGNMGERFNKYKAQTYISTKQWAILDRIENTMQCFGLID